MLLPPRLGARLLVLAGLLLVVIGFVVHAAHYGDYVDDDAGITFGYAKSWVAGRGLSVNPADAPVEGYSNPSWMMLLALTMRLGLFHWTWTPKLLGLLAGIVTLLFAAKLAAQLSARRLEPLHLLAPALLALNGSFVVWAVSGLENGLYGALVLGVFSCWLARREAPPAWLGVLTTALVITRPEAIGYGGLVLLDVALNALLHRERRAATLRFFAGFVLSFGLYAGWHTATFADVLPNTYYAKIDGEVFSPGQRLVTLSSSGWRYLREGLGDWNLGWSVPAALALGLCGKWQERGLPLAWALAAWGPFFVVTTGGDWMMEYRFLSPAYALFAALAAGGVVVARDWLFGGGFGWIAGRLPVRPISIAAAVVSAFALGWASLPLPSRAARIVAVPTMPLANTRQGTALFLSLAARVGVTTPVVVEGAMGGPALESDGRVVWLDSFGLTDRTIAHCFHRRCDPSELWRYALDERRADFLNFPPSMARRWDVVDAPAFKADFAPFRSARSGVGLYVRRDLLVASGNVTEQAAGVSGNVLVHQFTVLPADPTDGVVRADVVFEREGEGIPACFVAVAGGRPTRLPLLDFVLPSVFEEGVRYRDRVPLPEGLAEAQLVVHDPPPPSDEDEAENADDP